MLNHHKLHRKRWSPCLAVNDSGTGRMYARANKNADRMKMRSASMVQSHYFLKLCAFGVKPTARLHPRGLGTASLVESSTATEQSSCGFDSGPSSGSFFAGIGLARSPSLLCGSYHCDIVVRHHGLKPCASDRGPSNGSFLAGIGPSDGSNYGRNNACTSCRCRMGMGRCGPLLAGRGGRFWSS